MDQNKRRKLLLINPTNQSRTRFVIDLMPMGLGIVAALTPPDWDVELLDESFEPCTFQPADIVAFTSFTSTAPRAYELAEGYRKAGVYTVMGGVHASMLPDEVIQYVDTVFTGEAEGVWQQFLRDFEAGTPKRRYDGGITDIDKIPHVRRDIYKYHYTYDLVQTSRGCPAGCEFCSVTRYSGKTYRERKVEDILDELEETTRPMIFFVDDNLVNNKKGAEERAIRLFKGMVERGMKKHWWSQVAVNFGDNEEVLYWARKSGCIFVLMGIEAEKAEALRGIRKNLNLNRGVSSYHNIFRKLHKHGIAVLTSIIFAMESDTVKDLYDRKRFLIDENIDCYQCTILTPLPGTALYDRLEKDGKIVLKNYPDDWEHYHFLNATLDTPHLKTREIEQHMHMIWQELYNKMTMRKKMFRTLWNTKSFYSAYWSYALNHSFSRIVMDNRDIYHDSHDRGKRIKRKVYIAVTDKVIWLFYKLVWQRMLRKLIPHDHR